MLTSAAYHIRDLNTEVEDDEGIVSLPNNARICLTQLRRTCDRLEQEGIRTSAVVVAVAA